MNERITRVFGKDITYNYNIDWKQRESEDNTRIVFIDKPCITMEIFEENWKEICEFSGEPYFRKPSVWNSWDYIYISEDEKLKVINIKFRADLNEVHLFTDRVVNETHLNKEGVESDFNEGMRDFNKQMIESNEKMKDYCDVNKLTPADTDCIKLFRIVYGHDNYEIVNGKMKDKGSYTNIIGVNSVSSIRSFIGDEVVTTKYGMPIVSK